MAAPLPLPFPALSPAQPEIGKIFQYLASVRGIMYSLAGVPWRRRKGRGGGGRGEGGGGREVGGEGGPKPLNKTTSREKLTVKAHKKNCLEDVNIAKTTN